MSNKNIKLLVILALAAAGNIPAYAVDVSDIAIHGSASMTESSSDKYNFYGDTADKFDNNVRELTVNGGYRWANGLRVSVQTYASTVDGLNSLDLDFASLDYSVQPWFGVRVGRNKSTIGLYGDSQDLDQVRTFANLPLGVYPRNTRSLNYTDGITFYGNISAKRAGSFDYTVFVGKIEKIRGDSLISRASGGLTTTDSFDIPAAYGGTVFWNTPVDGLRFGVTVIELPHIGDVGHLSTKAFATKPGLTFSPVPLGIDAAYGAGAWDAMFANSPTASSIGLSEQFLSVEYTTGKWVFAAEYKNDPEHVTSTIPALGVANSYTKSREVDTYVMASYQATKKIGLGAYYGYTNKDSDHTGTNPSNWEIERDAAAVVSYAPVPYWLFKVEFHELNGLGLVNSAGDYNPNALTAGNKWNYLVLKTTFSF